MKRSDTKCTIPTASILAIISVTVLFFFPVLFRGETFYAFDSLMTHLPWSPFIPSDFRSNNPLITDPVNLIYPYHKLVKDALVQGKLPLWDPTSFCGIPVNSSGIPLNNPLAFLFTLFLPLTTAHDLLLLVHLFGAGIGMLLYLKIIGLRPYAAVIGSILWMFNGYAMVWLEFEMVTILACSLPLSLYFWERFIKTGSRADCLYLTGAIAISVSSGFPQILVYQFLFFGCYFLYRGIGEFITNRSSMKIGKRSLFSVCIALLIGLGLSANLIVAFFPVLNDTQREIIPFSELYARTGQLPVKYLLTLLYPDFFGNPLLPLPRFTPAALNANPYNNYNELCIYAGVTSLFLVLVAVTGAFKKKHIAFYLASLVLSLWMAMGSPLYYPLVKLVPGLGFSTPTRILYISGFSIVVSAALGADLIFSHSMTRKGLVFLLWCGLAAAFMGFYFYSQTEPGFQWAIGYLNQVGDSQILSDLHNHFKPDSKILIEPLLLMTASFICLSLILWRTGSKIHPLLPLLLICLISVDLMGFGLAYNSRAKELIAYPVTPAIKHLQRDSSKFRIITMGPFLLNSFKPYSFEDAGGYASFYPRRYGEYLHLAQYGTKRAIPEKFSRWISFSRFGSPLFDLLNVKYALLPPDFSIQKSRYELNYKGEIVVMENKFAFPRCFFVPAYVYCDRREKALQAIGNFSRQDFRQAVILETPPPADFALAYSGSAPLNDSTVDILEYQNNRIEIHVKASAEGFIVISDSYHPDWEAEEKGKRFNIYRANYIMRAIPVEKGEHNIILRFNPSQSIAGLTVSAASWACLIGLILFYACRGYLLKKRL